MAVIAQGFLFRKVDPQEKHLMEAIYRLRFKVYAKQRKLIREEDYPSGLESDEYDSHSIHFVALNFEDTVVATARMILTDEKPSPLLKSFPYIIHQHNIAPGAITEISRFLICKKLSKPPPLNNRMTRYQQFPTLSCRAIIVYGLCREIFQESRRRGITHWGALMEKSLMGLLRIYGFRMKCVGEDIDLFGPVRPYLGSLEDSEVAELWFLKSLLE